jgi:hypothetical protein
MKIKEAIANNRKNQLVKYKFDMKLFFFKRPLILLLNVQILNLGFILALQFFVQSQQLHPQPTPLPFQLLALK